MKEILEKFKKSGVRATPQRLAIFQFLNKSYNHPTVDDIYNAIREKYPSLSPATVYSSLQVLKKAGLIQELSIRRDRVCYDPIPTTHHHFLCQECGSITNIDITCPVAERKTVEGHKVNEVQAYFYGVCSECLTKNKKKI